MYSRELLRIAMIAPPYFELPPVAYGGIEAVVADLADSLVDVGHHVTVLGAGVPGTRADFIPIWEHSLPDQIGRAYP
ncbi:MAG: glycosyltransferase family 4 protein, partial [Longispora sp.]|nr:glycosyltransferase family 4 protein [Longispora sp. (in: high G+C Gram-positive bacteria)]